ncbi:MAG: phosphoribosylformylglycinamidine synthase, partial [Firmicutes bacterium]|nr:phosphoribosylformylglycinamidine synthase [Bacillota bacterium]
CGGATGSSKSHTTESLESCGAEVQKGNAPEERKLQRLFRDPEASRLIKRCNDFGAGGVSVAIGELADGLEIDLDAVPKKYAGLDGTELAISESQERMAVVVEAKDAARFAELAAKENVESTVVATVTAAKRLVMHWNGQTIVDISRDFLDTNGAPKATTAHAEKAELAAPVIPADFVSGMKAVADDLNTCSHQGMAERFDSTIGSGTVLMPFGGSRQKTPTQAMAYLLPLLHGTTEDCSFMAWGFDPFISAMSPYHGAYLAVVQSVARLVASGAAYDKAYLSFQEYFPRLGSDAKRWGLPLAALLGAFRAQMGLGLAAIGGKDSMSGSFEQLDVPPTLISFAVAMGKAPHALPNHFKAAGHRIALLQPEYDADGLPTASSLKALFAQVHGLITGGKALAAYTPGHGGVAAALLKMSLGEGLGVALDADLATLFGRNYGAFVIELADDAEAVGTIIGRTTADGLFSCGDAKIALTELEALHDGKLESVYPTKAEQPTNAVPAYTHTATSWPTPAVKTARPKALIPAFPGTNCEVDTARALEKAGAEAEIFVIKNLSSADISRSVADFAAAVQQAQMIVIPGGFSGGDEPDGSAKFIISFFRNPAVKEAVEAMLHQRDGLMAGICNGFQALVKLGLVPYGHIVEADANNPTLTFNCIGRHQSRLVRTRIASNKSPWLMQTQPGEIYTVPISHGEGRFLASPAQVAELAANGQIACQYVDEQGVPTMDITHNPNGSIDAIEGITSPDGRVFGKMGHSERVGKNLYRNVNGLFELRMFESAVKYFKG